MLYDGVAWALSSTHRTTCAGCMEGMNMKMPCEMVKSEAQAKSTPSVAPGRRP